MNKTEARKRLAAAVEALEVAHETLAAACHTSARMGAFAIVYALPLPLVDEADDDPPRRLTGAEAWEEAAAICSKIFFEPGQNTRRAVRLPGLLAADESLITAVREANRARQALRETLAALDGLSAKERAALVHSTAPGLSVMQATRQICVLPERPRRVDFIWNQGGRKTKRMTVAQAAALIEQALAGANSSGRAAALEAELRALAALPANEIVVRAEPIEPSPHAVVYPTTGTHAILHAALPLFYPDDGADPPEVDDLEAPTASSEGRRGRPPALEPEPISRSLGLYRYRPGFRAYGSQRPQNRVAFSRSEHVVVMRLHLAGDRERVMRLSAATLQKALRHRRRLPRSTRRTIEITAQGGWRIRLRGGPARRLAAYEPAERCIEFVLSPRDEAALFRALGLDAAA